MGQAKKNLRSCPAVGRPIPAAECGTNRMSRYACSADCPFNPWRPDAYEEVLDIYDRLEARLHDRLMKELAARGERFNPPRDDEEKLSSYVVEHLFRARDANGQTLVQRWQARGFDGLGNDEQVLLKGLAGLRLRALEIRTALDDQTCLAIDLLDPDAPPFTVVDRSLAAQTGRFFSCVGWLYELPQYRRLHASVLAIPEVNDLDPADVIRAVARHLGWTEGASPLPDWLDAHAAQFLEALRAVPPVLMAETMHRSNLRKTVAIYRVNGKSESLARALRDWPAAVPGEPEPALRAAGFRRSWDWIDVAVDPTRRRDPATLGDPVVGSVTLGTDQVLVSYSPGQDADARRSEFERFAGDRVEFVGTREDDLGLQLPDVEAVTPQQRALVPAELLQRARRLDLMVSKLPIAGAVPPDPTALRRSLDQRWPDEPVPGLGGLTPRQAALDPAQRPTLLRMVKERVRSTDRNQIEEGGESDPIALVRDLGLTELDVPAPPGLYLPPRAILPPLPAAALTEEEVITRVGRLTDAYPNVEDLIETFEEEAPDVEDLLMALGDEEGDTQADRMMELLTAQAWFILFPQGAPERSIDPRAVETAIDEAFERWNEFDEQRAKDDIDLLLKSKRQPALVHILQSGAFDMARSDERLNGLEFQVVFEVAANLRFIVDALDVLARPDSK